eukprot:6157382-Pyramimonas_sp.AAC.1
MRRPTSGALSLGDSGLSIVSGFRSTPPTPSAACASRPLARFCIVMRAVRATKISRHRRSHLISWPQLSGPASTLSLSFSPRGSSSPRLPFLLPTPSPFGGSAEDLPRWHVTSFLTPAGWTSICRP